MSKRICIGIAIELERSKTSIYIRITHTQTGVESYQEALVGFVRISNIKHIN